VFFKTTGTASGQVVPVVAYPVLTPHCITWFYKSAIATRLCFSRGGCLSVSSYFARLVS